MKMCRLAPCSTTLPRARSFRRWWMRCHTSAAIRSRWKPHRRDSQVRIIDQPLVREGMVELQLANLSRRAVLQTGCLGGSSSSPPLAHLTHSHSSQHPHPHPHSSYRDPATPVAHRHPLIWLALSLLLLRLKRSVFRYWQIWA